MEEPQRGQPLGLGPGYSTDEEVPEEVPAPAVDRTARPVTHYAPIEPPGADPHSPWGEETRSFWMLFEAVGKLLRQSAEAADGGVDVTPGGTHALDPRWGTVHPRGHRHASDPWTIMQNMERQMNMTRIGYEPAELLTMVKGMPMGCLLVSYAGAPSDETIPYHAAVLEPLEPHSLLCYGHDAVHHTDPVSGQMLTDGLQIFCSWRDAGSSQGSANARCELRGPHAGCAARG